jgi:shikimate kinase
MNTTNPKRIFIGPMSAGKALLSEGLANKLDQSQFRALH